VAIAMSVSVVLTGCSKSSSSAVSHPAPAVGAVASSAVLGARALAAAPSSAPAVSNAVAPSTAVAPSSPLPPSSAPPAADPPATPQLTAIALQPADLPAGWTASAPDPDPNGAAESATQAKCVGGRDNYSDETGESNSDDYSLDDATISSDVTSFRSQADVADDIAILKSPKIDACFVRMFESEAGTLPQGTSFDSASVLITPGSAGGPSNVVGTGAGKIEISGSAGQIADLYLNFAMITGPSIEAEIDFENLGSPVPASVRNLLIAKIAARAAVAAGSQT
jgi:hypothetical protein